MTELPADNVKRFGVTQSTEVSFWLLQKEDTPFLCLAFLASLLLHGLLFVILAATRIFQPFTGVSGEFELVWFSPSAMESVPMADEKKVPGVQNIATPTGAKRANRTGALKYPTAEQKAALPSIARTTPVVKPPSSRVVDVPEKLESGYFTAEADAEMVVSRFGGKVVEIVGKDIEIPVYRVFSAAQKSPGQRAMVQDFTETGNFADDTPFTVNMQETFVPAPVVDPLTKKSPAAMESVNEKAGNGAMKRSEKDVLPPVAERVAIVEKLMVAREQPVQLRQSSSTVRTTVSLPRSPAREIGITPREQQLRVAAVPLLSPKNPTEGDRHATRSAPGETVRPQRPEVSVPPLQRPVERQEQVMPKVAPAIVNPPPIVELKQKPVLGKPSPVAPEKPHAIFMPPLAGDLKIVITGKEDIKVEAVFREFRKARRGRPLTRGEARNRRSVPLKRARTNLNVHEAVVEIAEEGVYDLTIRSADGKPVTAAFVLKIHESGKGAVTKNLGRRTLPDGALLARILMPEGLFWDDESYFTGTMEDSDSITRFQTETGLVWREFR